MRLVRRLLLLCTVWAVDVLCKVTISPEPPAGIIVGLDVNSTDISWTNTNGEVTVSVSRVDVQPPTKIVLSKVAGTSYSWGPTSTDATIAEAGLYRWLLTDADNVPTLSQNTFRVVEAEDGPGAVAQVLTNSSTPATPEPGRPLLAVTPNPPGPPIQPTLEAAEQLPSPLTSSTTEQLPSSTKQVQQTVKTSPAEIVTSSILQPSPTATKTQAVTDNDIDSTLKDKPPPTTTPVTVTSTTGVRETTTSTNVAATTTPATTEPPAIVGTLAVATVSPTTTSIDASLQTSDSGSSPPLTKSTKIALGVGLTSAVALIAGIILAALWYKRRYRFNKGKRFSLTASEVNYEPHEPSMWRNTVARVKSMMPTNARVKSWMPMPIMDARVRSLMPGRGREPILPQIPPEEQSFTVVSGRRAISPEFQEVADGLRFEMSSTPRQFEFSKNQNANAAEQGHARGQDYPYTAYGSSPPPMPPMPAAYMSCVVPPLQSDTTHLLNPHDIPTLQVSRFERNARKRRSSEYNPVALKSRFSLASTMQPNERALQWMRKYIPFVGKDPDILRPNSRLTPEGDGGEGGWEKMSGSPVSSIQDMGRLEKLSPVITGEDFRGRAM